MFQHPNDKYVVPEQWYYMCVSYERNSNSMAEIKVFLDGISLLERNIETANASYILNLESTLKLGLCKTHVGEIAFQIFRGSISELNIWSRSLGNEEMKK